jgi:hypothetical protein
MEGSSVAGRFAPEFAPGKTGWVWGSWERDDWVHFLMRGERHFSAT